MSNVEFRQQIQDNPDDEILRYELLRYIDANEAIWRMFKFPLHYNSYTVYRLAVHLKNQQMILYAPHDEILNEFEGPDAADNFVNIDAPL